MARYIAHRVGTELRTSRLGRRERALPAKMIKPFKWGKLVLFGSIALWTLGFSVQTASAASKLATIATPEPLMTLWKTLKSALKEDRQIVSRCNADLEHCSSLAARRFNAIVEDGSAYEGLSRIGHINRAVNFSIRATSNGSPEKWYSPLSALTRGTGDCKQFALLKYAALSAVGYSADDLRILIVEDKSFYRPHAVVAVREGTRWLILNNNSLAIVELDDFLNYYRFLGALGADNLFEFAQQGDSALSQ
jgi:predicted transglutaminase-like cysteine proteinase